MPADIERRSIAQGPGFTTGGLSRFVPMLVLFAVVGCTATEVGQESPAATQTRVVTRGEQPTPPQAVQVGRFSQIGSTLSVELTNPNAAVGLSRAEFELALIGADGAAVDVLGQSGPGSPNSTIHQLPPSGRYGFEIFRHPAAASFETVELTILSGWVPWPDAVPQVTVIEPVVTYDGRYAHVTGRVDVDARGPYNVWVMAFLDVGGQMAIAADAADCVSAGSPRAFEVVALIEQLPAAPEIEEVVAYTTTIPGDLLQQAPGC